MATRANGENVDWIRSTSSEIRGPLDYYEKHARGRRVVDWQSDAVAEFWQNLESKHPVNECSEK